MISSAQPKSTKGRLLSVTNSTNQENHELIFDFNPSSISEQRGVKYNYSEGQGQMMPLAQYGMAEPTKLSFELFMFDHTGVTKQLKSLRRLTLPKHITRLTYYEQVKPHKYLLDLKQYGMFHVAIDRIDITTTQYHKTTLAPIRLTAAIECTVISSGLSTDVSMLKVQGGYS